MRDWAKRAHWILERKRHVCGSYSSWIPLSASIRGVHAKELVHSIAVQIFSKLHQPTNYRIFRRKSISVGGLYQQRRPFVLSWTSHAGENKISKHQGRGVRHFVFRLNGSYFSTRARPFERIVNVGRSISYAEEWCSKTTGLTSGIVRSGSGPIKVFRFEC